MTDYMGRYDALLNSVYTNAPIWMRPEAYTDLFVIYDNTWKSPLTDLFPKTPAVRADGTVIEKDTAWTVNTSADPQTMTPFGADYFEMPRPRAVAFNREESQCRMIKEWGPVSHPLQFKEQFKAGFLDKAQQLLVTNAVRSMERNIEYTLCSYVRLVSGVVSRFGNQYTAQSGRSHYFDASELDTGSAKYLEGKKWTNPAADLIGQLNTIDKYYSEFAGDEVKRAFIGINTAFGMETNTGLVELLKYHYDATQTKIATSIKGVKFQKVIGQTYKDDATSNSGRIGYPGLGDVRPDSWAARKVNKMMTMTSGGASVEWALFANSTLGNLYTAKCMPDHTNTNAFYANEWEDARTKMMFSEMMFAYAPRVDDFAKVMVVEATALATV